MKKEARKINTLFVVEVALFSATYALLVVFLMPISFYAFQVRIADAIIPLSIVFGYPVVIGVTLGCATANFFGGLGLIDVIFGSIANFIASILAMKIGAKKTFLGALTANVVVSLVVGAYLSFLLGIPLILSLAGLFVGSTISINVLGYMLTVLIKRYMEKTGYKKATLARF